MKLRVLWLSLVVAWHAGFAAPSVGARQAAPPSQTKIDVSKLGPQVGERVPDFSLKDQTGKTQTLQSMMGPKGAMLVFIRSADW
jgi:hypothetical protein